MFTGRVCWWDLNFSVRVARVGEMDVLGRYMLVEAKSRCFGGALLREGNVRALCAGQSEVTVFWGFAVARRHLKGDVGWPERSHGVLVPRESCAASRGVTALWWLALVRRVSIRICDFTGCHFVSSLIFFFNAYVSWRRGAVVQPPTARAGLTQ